MRSLGLDVGERRPQQRQAAPQRAADAKPAGKDPPPAEQPKARPQLLKTYDYVSEAGEFLFQVCRMEPKNFLQRRRPREGDAPSDIKPGNWVWKRDGITQVPYRLPELLEAISEERIIFVTEGEKDTDSLTNRLGVPASCNAGGAGKWPDELTAYFQDADVVIVPDNDPQAVNSKTGELRWHPDGRPVLPGQDHAKLVASKLAGVAKRVRILALPDLPLKGDASDWIEAGGTSEQLYQLVEEKAVTPAAYQKALDISHRPKAYVSKYGAVMWGDPKGTRQKYEYVIKGLIPRRETVLIYGPAQSGKSFFAQDLAMAIARGGEYQGRKVRRGIVIYCAAEAGAGFVYNRFAGYATGKGIPEEEPLPFICLTRRFDLFADEQQTTDLINEIKCLVAFWKQKYPDDDIELEAVVIDTMNKVTPGMDEISGKDVSLMIFRFERIMAECSTGLWLVHHMNAAGTGPRGHTSLFAAFETAIRVGKYDHSDKNAPPRFKDGEKWRDRRYTQITKQREGEDGEITDFYLRGVVSGYDDDNAPIPGAVVEWIDTPAKKAADKAIEQVGVSMTDQRRNVYAAILIAMEESGQEPPRSLGLPKSITRVVNSRRVGEVYRKYRADPEDSEEAIKKALTRANDFLTRNGFIGRNNPWVWVVPGKRIKGEQRALPPPEEPPQDDPTEALNEDDVDWSQMNEPVLLPAPEPGPELAGAME
jgi:hypothetical protein